MRTVSRRALKLAAAATALLALSGCQAGGSLSQAIGIQPAAMDAETRDRQLRLAAAARATGQAETAAKIYKGLLAANPNASDVQTAYAETLFEARENSRALDAYNKALLDPDAANKTTVQALIGRGRVLLALDRWI